MKHPIFRLRNLFILSFLLCTRLSHAQEATAYSKNAFAVDITKLMINEISLSYEHSLSYRKSIEFTGGLVYVNDYWKDIFKGWKNATLFSEHGYTGRVDIKIYKRQEDNSKWRDYISFGLVYKHLYYYDVPVTSDTKYDSTFYKMSPELAVDSGAFAYTETYLRDETRDKIGIEFVWGKVYSASNTFDFEFYYGAGIDATFTTHTDHDRYPTYTNPKHQWKAQPIPDYTYDDFYMRPSILVGFKLKIKT